jgi:aryl-alcohol dehydrogenase-like predicted oxidoreductase
MHISKITLGSTGQEISCLGLGTMYFGTKIDETGSFDMLDYYAQNGGAFLDSANKYASWIPGCKGGESEMLIGKWMNDRKNRLSMFISSKVGFAYGETPRSLKKELIISECEKSLKRLNVDTIDLYFAHAFDALTPLEETMEAFYELKKSGKIRFAGASNFYAWQLSEANVIANQQGWEGFTCLQQRHSYLDPVLQADFGTQLLLTPETQEFCNAKGLTMMAYSPLLGGAYSRTDRLLSPYYLSYSSDVKLAALKEVSSALNVSPNAVVLAWMLQNKPQVIPIVSGSSVEQLEENLKALKIELTKEQLGVLNQSIVLPNRY